MGTLKDSARTGRNLFWTFKGIEECGGGFLGLFLSKLIERNEKRKEMKSKPSKSDKFFDSLLDIFDEG